MDNNYQHALLYIGLMICSVMTVDFLTCKDLKSMYPAFESGIYEIYLPSGEHEVYCEMGINGGGYTFIPASMISKMRPSDMHYLVTNDTDVLLRISRPDGSQPYTVVTQYYNTGGLSVQLSTYADHAQPLNTHMGPYIYLGTLPASDVVKKTKQKEKLGFKSNGQNILYEVCGIPKGNSFAFYSNPNEKPMTDYHRSIPLYEKSGVAVDWRKSAKRPFSGRRMPLSFFLFTEMHYGGCGCYTSSERWLDAVSPALGTAIGLR